MRLNNSGNNTPVLTSLSAIAVAPEWSSHWTIRVLYGPHGAPDFFTPEDISEFFAADWKVLRNTGFARFPWSKALRLDKETKAELSDPKIHGYDVIRNLVDSGAISPEVGRDATVEALLSAYKKEPGESLADIVNAVTRAAHENLVDAAARDVMERRAGMLVPVLARVARGEDAQVR